MNPEELKELTQKGEMEYAPIPPSGRGNKKEKIRLKDILDKLKPFSVRKPVAYIVGSLATHGESDNDIDIVVRGEDWSPQQKMAFDFRLYRMFADILEVPYDEVPEYLSIHYSNTGPFTPYIPIYEETFIPIKDAKIVEMSYDFTLRGNIEFINKSDDNKRIIAGYASVAIIDSEGDLIPVEVLKEGIKTWLSNPLYANIMFSHKSIQIGRVIDSYKDLKTHVDDKGLFIVAELRDDLEIANEIWEKILKGEIKGFSIAGEILKYHTECDEEKCWRVIDKINIYEASVCQYPINEKSTFTVVSKAQVNCVCGDHAPLEIVSEDVKCDNCEIMAKKRVIEKAEEEKKDTEEEQTDTETEEKAENEENTESNETETEEKSESESAEEKCDEEENEEEDIEETEEKDLGLIGVIKEQLAKLMEEATGEIKEKLQEILDMMNHLRGGYPYPMPARYPYPTKYPYPTGLSGAEQWPEMVVHAIDDLYGVIEEYKTKIAEFEKAIAEKEKIIENLKARIETLEKSEEAPKTESITVEEKAEVESDVIVDRGRVYFKEL